ncbi:hypothetical protein O988_00965 [Pseudogymnoascus sp. VKM F-3808]|nr:hypothetical protein O988_00965 [Pseudogymnoascus sp. VKM F-3808]
MSPILLALVQLLPIALCLSTTQPAFTAAELSHEVVTFDKRAAAASASPLNRQLLGLSIEFCWITSYLGDLNQPNALSLRLLQNIQDLSGFPPRIRVGGNTQDVANYCDDCTQTLKNTFASNIEINTEAANVTFNKNLFRVLNENAPSEQEYTFGLNLGENNLSNTLAEFKAVRKHMNLSRITAYELGNEPDFYSTNRQFRPLSWDIFSYAQQTASFLTKITASLSKSEAKRFVGYMAGSFANSPVDQGIFSLGSLIKMGIKEVVNEIKIFSNHCYFGDVCTPEHAALVSLPVLLNHIHTIDTVQQFTLSISAAKSVGAKFILGETNSAACHGLAGVSNSLGAALWMLDYSLTGATVGMDGLYFHNGVGFPYSAWQPIAVNGTAAHASGLYYGFLLFADLVSNLGRTPEISPIPSLDSTGLAHYAVYSSSFNLQKLVILNLDYINGTNPRTYKTFDVSSEFGKHVTVKRLSGSSSIATQGLTWAGQTVDENGHLTGAKVIEKVTNGVVSIGSSEAVIIERAY